MTWNKAAHRLVTASQESNKLNLAACEIEDKWPFSCGWNYIRITSPPPHFPGTRSDELKNMNLIDSGSKTCLGITFQFPSYVKYFIHMYKAAFNCTLLTLSRNRNAHILDTGHLMNQHQVQHLCISGHMERQRQNRAFCIHVTQF